MDDDDLKAELEHADYCFDRERDELVDRIRELEAEVEKQRATIQVAADKLAIVGETRGALFATLTLAKETLEPCRRFLHAHIEGSYTEIDTAVLYDTIKSALASIKTALGEK